MRASACACCAEWEERALITALSSRLFTAQSEPTLRLRALPLRRCPSWTSCACPSSLWAWARPRRTCSPSTPRLLRRRCSPRRSSSGWLCVARVRSKAQPRRQLVHRTRVLIGRGVQVALSGAKLALVVSQSSSFCFQDGSGRCSRSLFFCF